MMKLAVLALLYLALTLGTVLMFAPRCPHHRNVTEGSMLLEGCH